MRRLGFRTNALVVNDALIALVAATGDDPGVVLISGTGSIAYGVNHKGFAARSGGWGYVLGDEGSGYWIGQKALHAIVRSTDGRGSPTRLTTLVLEHLQLTKVEGLVHEVYDRGLKRQSVAALGPVVERARADGDLVAAEIMNAAAAELVRAAASVIQRLQMRGLAFRIVLAGSMFRLVPWLTESLIHRLAEVAPRATVARLETEPAVGALRLALRAARGEVKIPPYLETPSPTTA
jgi:N-acetylglucosamine kinase-like BadF-type ATPase